MPAEPPIERTPRGYRDAAARTWPDHQGLAVPDAVYAVPADPAIGDVRTAWSNQSVHGFRAMPAKRRLMLVLGVAALVGTAGFVGGALSMWLLSLASLGLPAWTVYGGCSLLALVGLGLAAKPRPACSYVAERGIQEHVEHAFGGRDNVLLFADAASATLRQVERYSNGVYQGTDFALTFRSPERRVLLELAGLRFDQGMWAAADNPMWDLARAAQARWNEVRWARAEEEHRTTGEVAFRAGKQTLRVGDHRLSIDGGPEPIVLGPGDVEQLAVKDGMLVVRRAGATEGLLRAQGIHRFAISEIDDFEVLARALRTWGGWRLR